MPDMATEISPAPCDAQRIARAHAIRATHATPDFMNGVLLGNGALGVTVTTRPDAVVFHLGHNDIWDKRVDESHKDHVLTFDEVLARVEDIDPGLGPIENDPWFASYRAEMAASYSRPYPRPLPCGSVILGFDRRCTQLLGHELDISSGVCTVELKHRGTRVNAEIFIDQGGADDLHVRCVTTTGEPVASPFTRLRLLPDPEGPAVASRNADAPTTFILPRPGELPIRAGVSELELGAASVGFSETMPSLDGGFEDPLGLFDVRVRSSATFVERSRPNWYGHMQPNSFLERSVDSNEPFGLRVELRYTYSAGDSTDDITGSTDLATGWRKAETRSLSNWEEYWSRSAIALSDTYLERVWYRNTYFAHCALRPGIAAPGLFGNWMYRSYGAAWHGDYHMNYNAQQIYWGTFSSNRVEQHLPYVELVEKMAPVAQAWATGYYGMRGAAYPHSAYNAPMTVNPYPNPVWAWELSESPWTVQSLWWHYQFTQDEEFLRDRALPLIRDVVLFLSDYLSRAGANGGRWDDDVFHIYPTVPPELYGLSPELRLNSDCLLDITLIRFTFNAFLTASDVLHLGDADKPLQETLRHILDNLPEYPTAQTPDGDVFISVPGEHPDVVYNVPVPGMTVFPGEEHSWESDPDTLAIVTRSVKRQLLEGGNDLVFANLQAARLGILDLDKFAQQLRYCELGNGTFTDMVLQTEGRYNDATDFSFMKEKGVWVENFALTAVINELLMQSYSGTIRVFANCDELSSARFESLRAPGAFLVSAEKSAGEVRVVRVVSEKGCSLKILLPWVGGATLVSAAGKVVLAPGIHEIPTHEGETLTLLPTTEVGAE